MNTSVSALAICLLSCAVVHGQPGQADLGEQARGASRVVVATVVDVTSRFGTNASGDRLIFSDIVLEVSETLKGDPLPFITMTVEGGDIGGMSLEVSDLPIVRRGDRGLYFLQKGRGSEWVPHRRGSGIMKLAPSGRFENTTMSLADARRQIRNAIK